MGFSRQNYWSMLPFTGDLPNQGCNLESVFQGDSLLSEPQGKTLVWKKWDKKGFCKLKLIIYDSYWVTCSVQFSSATQSCPTLCNPVNCRTPGLPVHHQLPESTQTNVHWVSDAIQLSHPLSSPSSSCPQSFPASGSFQMSQLFPSSSQNIGVSASTSVPSINTQDWSPLGWTGWTSL